MRHKTAMPEIKLESAPIIQRHINSYLFSFFVSQYGGLNLATSIRDVFGLNQNTINGTLYKQFCDFLTDVINGRDCNQAILVDHYNYIIEGSIMDGLPIAIAAQNALTAIIDIYNDAQSMVDMYNHDLAALVDVRTTEEFMKGHLAGAVSVSSEDLLGQKFSQVERFKDKTIVVIGKGYDDVTAYKCAKNLKKKGYKSVILNGGMQEWTINNYPVVKG